MSDQPMAYNTYNNKFYIVNSISNHDAKIYIDKDSYLKFRNSDKDKSIQDLQRKGIALPILTTEHHTSIFHRYMLEISKCCSKESGDVDFCNIKLVHKKPYRRYEFQLTAQTIVLFYHRNYPFGDFEFEGRRYRWIVYSEFNSLKDINYRFALYELSPERLTLMSDTTGQVNEESPLIDDFLGRDWNSSFESRDFEQLTTPKRIGQFDITDRFILGVKNGQFEINTPTEINTINNVPEDILLFLSMIALLKVEEEIKENEEKIKHSSLFSNFDPTAARVLKMQNASLNNFI